MKKNKLNQKGVVSFITVAFLAGILLLITMGFMRVMISNQRQSLDNQLSTQAFYAAESGINDALADIGSLSSAFGSSDCNAAINILGNNALDGTTPIKYTCLLVDNKVDEIRISNATTESGKMYQLKAANGATINRVEVYWGDNDQTYARPNTSFPPNKIANWPNTIPPLLRVTIYYPGDNYSRGNLVSSQKTFFLVPVGGNNTNVSTGDGAVSGIGCPGGTDPDFTYRCKAVITISPANGFPPSGLVKNGLYIKIRPIYNTSTIYIKGLAGSAVKLQGAQVMIDATGRANDVYRRLQIRKDMVTEFNYPEYATQTANSICKQFITYPGAPPSDESGCSF
jgi:Tfp pilus assembly protein PilX